MFMHFLLICLSLLSIADTMLWVIEQTCSNSDNEIIFVFESSVI